MSRTVPVRAVPFWRSGRFRRRHVRCCRKAGRRGRYGGVAASLSCILDADPRMPKMTSASTPSRSISLTRRWGSLTRWMPFLPSSNIPLLAMMSTRLFWPGTSFAPLGPTPLSRPKLAPFLVTHCGPSGPSVTYGMRSRNSLDASETKSSGGIQGMSRWQSADIRLYCMGFFLVCFLEAAAGTMLDRGWYRGQVSRGVGGLLIRWRLAGGRNQAGEPKA
jgi:hypothetical protein